MDRIRWWLTQIDDRIHISGEQGGVLAQAGTAAKVASCGLPDIPGGVDWSLLLPERRETDDSDEKIT